MLRNSLIAAIAFFAVPGFASAIDLPSGGKVEKVDFERHIMGLLSKTGCNLGSCHGSFQGKNGFRLSLFGYEPVFDYAALSRDNLGRRVNVQNPDESLLLLKGAGRVPHEGGVRFSKDTWIYDTFKAWIDSGATHTPGSGAIQELKVTPSDFAVIAAKKSLQLRVHAKFTDGTTEDITPFCDFKISDDSIATVSNLGMLNSIQPGDAGLTVLYRGSVRALRVLVPAPSKAGAKYPDIKPVNNLDREIFAKLKLLNMVPSETTEDHEFLRRIYIDTIGILPTSEQVRTFMADKSPDKRNKKIDELLAHPLHSAIWATKLSDITGNNTLALENPQQMQIKRSQLWHDWLRKRIQDNVPYDKIVRDILTASTADDMKPEELIEFIKKVDAQIEKSGFDSDYANKKTLDLFWRRQQTVPIEQWGEKVAAAFLGVRLECAQCHKHPTDRWTQEDYWGFANLFAPIAFVNNQNSSPEVKKLFDAENARRREGSTAKNNNINIAREMFFATMSTTAPGGRGNNFVRPIPMTNKFVNPRTLGGEDVKHTQGTDSRMKVWEWMTDKSNPFFAKSFVNRVWGHYFGIGIVNPIDDFSMANSPTNARLLDVLAQNFIDSGYDLRKLEKMILQTHTYQLSSRINDTNKFDRNNFARSYVRPMMAEQVVDVLNAGIGVEEAFNQDAPLGKKMTEIGASRLNNPNLAYILRIFGRPPRTTACDCERAMEPALPQTLFRMTDPTITQKVSSNTGRVAKIIKDKLTDEQAIDELFLGTLSRLPNDTEKTKALEYIKAEKTRTAGLQDVLWALINTREFILNH